MFLNNFTIQFTMRILIFADGIVANFVRTALVVVPLLFRFVMNFDRVSVFVAMEKLFEKLG